MFFPFCPEKFIGWKVYFLLKEAFFGVPAVPFFRCRCKFLASRRPAPLKKIPQVYAAPRLPHVEAQDWTLVAPRCDLPEMLGGKFREKLGEVWSFFIYFSSPMFWWQTWQYMAMNFPYIWTKKPTNKKEPKINIDKKKPMCYYKRQCPKRGHKKNPKRAKISNVWVELWGNFLRFWLGDTPTR